MAINIEKLNSEAIIILTGIEPLAVPDDPMTVMQEVVNFKKEVGRPVYRILDFSQTNLTFSDMMMSMAFEKDQEGGANDPAVSTVIVGKDELVRLGADSLRTQEQYGKANVSFAASVNDALTYIRSERNKTGQ